MVSGCVTGASTDQNGHMKRLSTQNLQLSAVSVISVLRVNDVSETQLQ